MKSKLRLNHKWINSHALGIVKALQENGFETYLVGGCVRDLLVGIEPKDFDISTTARPRQVKKIIGNSFIIGRRFRLVLVKRDEEQFEISTFRRAPTEEDLAQEDFEGDNLFGTPDEDALRRDFTLNALFYDPVRGQIVDLANGLNDLKARKLKMIGDPDVRLVEDPIRILRAIRLAHKTGCSIDPDLKDKISKHAPSLKDTALPRRREEILKFLRLKNPFAAFMQMYDLGVLEQLSPEFHFLFENETARAWFYQLCVKASADFRKTAPTHYLFMILLAGYILGHTTIDEACDWLKDEPQQSFLKFELGLFNVEGAAIGQTFKQLSELTQIDLGEFERKGARRKVGLLSQKSFPMALTLGQWTGMLSDYEVAYWSEQYLKHEKEWTKTPISDNS